MCFSSMLKERYLLFSTHQCTSVISGDVFLNSSVRRVSPMLHRYYYSCQIKTSHNVCTIIKLNIPLTYIDINILEPGCFESSENIQK